MEVAAARAIVNSVIRELRWALQLQRWRIDLVFERLDAEKSPLNGRANSAHCLADPSYLRATITIDAEAVEDGDDLLGLLLHELIHIGHAEFALYRRQVNENLTETAASTIDLAYLNACEHNVMFVERLLRDGLGLDARRLIKQSKRHSEKERAS